MSLVFGLNELAGSFTGSAIENEDNLALPLVRGIKPMTEVISLEDAVQNFVCSAGQRLLLRQGEPA